MTNKTAFLFPGQGSQFPGMGKSLVENRPAARLRVEQACEILGFDIGKLMLEGPEDALRLTENTQPAILLASVIALEAVLDNFPVEPAAVAGHSLGEFSACWAAGALSFEDAIRLVRKRGELMQSAVPVGKGAMSAVIGLSSSQIAECLAQVGGEVSPANFNSPEQTVIAGEAEAVAKAGEALKEFGAKKVVPLPVSAPFHTSMMIPAREGLAEFMKDMEISDPKTPVIRNVDAQASTTAAQVRQGLIDQVTGCVLWVDSMNELGKMGVSGAYEIGPGKVLAGLMRRIDKSIKVKTVGEMEDIENLAKEAHAQA